MIKIENRRQNSDLKWDDMPHQSWCYHPKIPSCVFRKIDNNQYISFDKVSNDTEVFCCEDIHLDEKEYWGDTLYGWEQVDVTLVVE